MNQMKDRILSQRERRIKDQRREREKEGEGKRETERSLTDLRDSRALERGRKYTQTGCCSWHAQLPLLFYF